MNPIYRSDTGSNTGRYQPNPARPTLTTTSAQHPSGPQERYVSLETMYEVKRQNDPATINDDFTVSFDQVNHSDQEHEVERIGEEPQHRGSQKSFFRHF